MNARNWNVLVVEDESDSLELIQGILSYQNISSTGCASAEEALATVDKVAPSLVVIDLALPGMDGWSLLKQLKSKPSLAHVPMVAITSYHTLTLAEKAIEAGFDAYFAKPIDATSFVRELESLVTE